MSVTSTPRVTDEHHEAFQRDGVVHIRSAVGPERIEQIHRIAEQVLAAPSGFAGDVSATGAGRMFTDRYLWRDNPDVRDYVFNSGVAGLAGELMGASSVRFYFDHLLIKEPDTPDITPWHQDIPYWPFLGKQIASVWVTANDVTVADSGMEFVRGSHRWDRYFTPKAFTAASAWAEDNRGDQLPDIDAARDDYDIIGFDMEAGDALVFSAWTVHWAPGNTGSKRRVALSTRWLGDDSVWHPRPSSDPAVRQEHTVIQPDQYPADDDRFPEVWRASA